jgi:RNA polymerase sigma factor (sigma-70 family)
MNSEGGRRIPEQYADELGLFYDAYAGWLSGHARARTQGEQEHVADLVQDTFEAAARNWETLRDLAPGQQKAWLRSTVFHKAADHVRRRTMFRRKQAELRRTHEATEPGPERQVLLAAALERAAKIIESLPARQQRIALMKWNDHMTESGIAAELGCAKGTVAAQVHEIRRKLIDGLGSYYPFTRDDGEGEA